MPVFMPPFPAWIAQDEHINVTVHYMNWYESGLNVDHLVFSRNSAQGIARPLGILSVANGKNSPQQRGTPAGTAIDDVDPVTQTETKVYNDPDWLLQWRTMFKDAEPAIAQVLNRHLTVPAGRALLTGHIMALRKYGPLTCKPTSEDIVTETAMRFRELTEWGETSAAFVIANLYNMPLPTVHSRIRLAKKRGIIVSPGTPIRRLPIGTFGGPGDFHGPGWATEGRFE